jgi:hypothetical protein
VAAYIALAAIWIAAIASAVAAVRRVEPATSGV